MPRSLKDDDKSTERKKKVGHEDGCNGGVSKKMETF